MNKTVLLDEIPYCPDSCELFERIRDLPGASMLDSSFPHASSGRFDILTAAPEKADVPSLSPGANEAQCRGFFSELGRFLREHFGEIQPVSQDIPFCGGILGYLGYECGKGLNKISTSSDQACGPLAPAVQLRAYEWAVIQDHLLRRTVLVAQPRTSPAGRRDLLARLCRPAGSRDCEFHLRRAFKPNFEVDDYRRAFEKIQAYIHAGDCYQVNLAQRFSAPFEGDPWRAYRVLRSIAGAPFSAYLAGDEGDAIISLSPERYISLHGHRVETSPIKGTRPRYSDSREDELAAAELRDSDKDRAENLMIVDLLRNDLGRSCNPGSIHVDRLFEVQSFPTVHHLVSTISGELREDCSAVELLRDSFPGGSITGAPKRRAMEIIAELEPDPREVYCGSILYIGADGRMDSNIAIRTLLCRDGEVHCWGGGGIVADSQWQREYQETFDKVGQFLSALEAC
jgi:para-aminobenzoate synthetase component 1